MTIRRAALTVSGVDSTAFLNRMLTNLLDRQSVYAALLEPNGTLVAGAYWQYDEATDDWWALSMPDQIDALATGLQRYVFFRDQVVITPQPEQILTVSKQPGNYLDTGFAGTVTSRSAIGTSLDVAYDPAPTNRRRAGIPVFGIEVLPGDIILNWDMGYCLAIKGCYVGQEVVERMWSRCKRGKGRTLVEFPSNELADIKILAEIRAPYESDNTTLALSLCKSPETIADTRFRIPVCEDVPSLALPYEEWCANTNES